jgi:anti-sigma factor RsiW
MIKQLPKLTCYYVGRRFDAYRKREVSVRERRYIASHMATCPSCKATYAETNAFRSDMERDLSSFGQATRPQMTRMWLNIHREMQLTEAPPRSYRPYGMVATLVVAFFGFSLLGSNVHASSLSIVDATKESAATASPTPTAIALYVEDISLESSLTPTAPRKVLLQNTPESTQDQR